MSTAAGLAYREAGPGQAPTVLLVHGYPESSWMWTPLLGSLAEAGWRAVAPDLAGYGDSPPDPPGTWTRHVESLERFRDELGLEGVVLVVHDWGGLIGLRWACDHPDAVRGLIISNTGFFADGKWHGFARAMRAGQLDEIFENMDREGFAGILQQAEPNAGPAALDEYWKGLSTPERRRAGLALYKSGDFEELAPYQGRIAALGVPTLILWGESDDYAPVATAHRLKKEIPHAELVVLDGVGHFVMEDEPERVCAELASFLTGL